MLGRYQRSSNSRSSVADRDAHQSHDDKSYLFLHEIEVMMFAMGDSRTPLSDTTKLIHSLVHRQITLLLIKAVQLDQASNITVESLTRLLIGEEELLLRMIRYLKLKDNKTQSFSSVSDELPDDMELINDATVLPNEGKRIKRFRTFFNHLENEKLLSLLADEQTVDVIKRKRLERAEKQAKNMDSSEYKRFAEARTVTLCQVSLKSSVAKFKEWIFAPQSNISPPVEPMALEILSFLTHELMATLMDAALTIKSDRDLTVSVSPLILKNFASQLDTNDVYEAVRRLLNYGKTVLFLPTENAGRKRKLL